MAALFKKEAGEVNRTYIGQTHTVLVEGVSLQVQRVSWHGRLQKKEI